MIRGLNINQIPFKNIKLVGLLMFKEYPSTVVYSDDKGTPYILEWVDFISDINLDRYFIYESKNISLKRFIEKKATHFDLIHEARNGVVIFFDGSLEKATNISI